MSTIATALARLEAAVERRRGFGGTTSRCVAVSTDGLRCTTQEGSWSIETDLPGALGGSGAAPTPGVLLRAALGSCMVMSYRLRAERHGVEVTTIRVTVETDSEIVGMLSCDADPPPGCSEIRYHVDIESSADADDVRRIVDEGDRLSPLLDTVERLNAVRRTISIRSTGTSS